MDKQNLYKDLIKILDKDIENKVPSKLILENLFHRINGNKFEEILDSLRSYSPDIIEESKLDHSKWNPTILETLKYLVTKLKNEYFFGGSYDTEKFGEFLHSTFYSTENRFLDAYSSAYFEIDHENCVYLNTYGQEDIWDEIGLIFDINLITEKGIYVVALTKENKLISWYGKLPIKIDLLELGGKRGYYFNPETNIFKMRYPQELYNKISKEYHVPGSEDDLSGAKLAFRLEKLSTEEYNETNEK